MIKKRITLGEYIMKPRIFVSSTFYDLKYVREDIANFIKAHDFDPVMFEDGDIGYKPGKPLDKSCYEAMRAADMVILIIGGNYGSPSSDGITNNADFENYISVTRKEFETAVEEGIPVFAFIDSAVYSEYNVFELNKKYIFTKRFNFKFSATKDINIFSFIHEIKSLGSISITEFKRASDIKDFLSKQWSDMFKSYLKSLRKQEEYKRTHDSIDDLKTTIKELQLLVNGVFEKTFNNQIELEYDSVKDEQRKIHAQSIAKLINRNINYEVKKYYNEYDLKQILISFVNIINEAYINYQNSVLKEKNNDLAFSQKYMHEIVAKSREVGIFINRINSEIMKINQTYNLSDELMVNETADFLLEQYLKKESTL